MEGVGRGARPSQLFTENPTPFEPCLANVARNYYILLILYIIYLFFFRRPKFLKLYHESLKEGTCGKNLEPCVH